MNFRTSKIILSFSLLVFSISCNTTENKAIEELNVSDTTTIKKPNNPVLLYGIPSDSFNLVTGHIKPNGFLSGILLKYGISMSEIDQLVKNSGSVFDVRNIKSGNNYILFCGRDSLAKARYMVYEHDPTTSYIFSFNDSLNITPFRKKISGKIKYASGTIETSLWDAMMAGGLHASLASELSEIFAWTVDFFGLQKGDSFKVIYEELYIDDKSLGAGRIYGAQFNWSGNVITAIPFIQDSTETFFDIEGNSLRKAFLKAPLQFSRISSRFSANRMHPILRIRRAHFGVDYAAPLGTPVHSIGDGRVISATTENGSGKMVRIQHNSVYATAYLHLSRFGTGITGGAFVKQGQIIGYVGSSGLSTGPHLDFRFYKNGSPVDPLKVEAPPVEPVSEMNLARFEKNKQVVLSLLGTFN
ncbi:MAG: peptidoglycan DD-metalloendopeptidase family protein [Bacteroidales bacterium]|nr:peptidoglycan DD-metalloendopeptidase family protein [Bacteroidales bacterium]MBK7628969.1 peptidoglycan DD-metalloendopeptidase family protein [Bacteroidales bacterium]